LIAVLISSAVGLVSTPGWALLSDRVGRRPPYLFGAATSVVALTLFFVAAGTGSAIAVVVAIVFGVNVVHDSMYGRRPPGSPSCLTPGCVTVGRRWVIRLELCCREASLR